MVCLRYSYQILNAFKINYVSANNEVVVPSIRKVEWPKTFGLEESVSSQYNTSSNAVEQLQSNFEAETLEGSFSIYILSIS